MTTALSHIFVNTRVDVVTFLLLLLLLFSLLLFFLLLFVFFFFFFYWAPVAGAPGSTAAV
jgi:hypothetical protein